jgi:hypothetical protein
MEVPDIQYTRSGDAAIAYRVLGDGPVDVIWFRAMVGGLLSTCATYRRFCKCTSSGSSS